jgi:hypothetical protein
MSSSSKHSLKRLCASALSDEHRVDRRQIKGVDSTNHACLARHQMFRTPSHTCRGNSSFQTSSQRCAACKSQVPRIATAIPSFSFRSPAIKPSFFPAQHFPGRLPFASYAAKLQLALPAQKFSEAHSSMQSSKLYTKASDNVAAPEELLIGDSRSQWRVKVKFAVLALSLISWVSAYDDV